VRTVIENETEDEYKLQKSFTDLLNCYMFSKQYTLPL